MKNNFIIMMFVFWSCIGLAQQKRIFGKVIDSQGPIAGVVILNLNSEKETRSSEQGTFSILMEEEDLLVFTSMSHAYQRKTLTKSEWESQSITVELIVKIQELDEVVIDHSSQITAQSVGVINYTPKQYTHAERKLYTSRSGLVDPLINWMSGKTKRLKQGVQIEAANRRYELLGQLYEDSFYINQLEIPEDYVASFKVFVSESEEFVKVQKGPDELRELTLAKLATVFKSYLKEYEEDLLEQEVELKE